MQRPEDKSALNRGHRGNIMVVDDDTMNRRVLRRFLETENYSVAEARGGLEALDLLKHSWFDLVLLDINMPDVDGYQTLATLKLDKRLRDLPVIMVSSLDDLPSVVRCFELGANTYVVKPLSRILLTSRIEACLKKNRLRDWHPEEPRFRVLSGNAPRGS